MKQNKWMSHFGSTASVVFAATLSVTSVTSVHAAVMDITSATFSPGTMAQDNAEVITSITVGGKTLSTLEGADHVAGSGGATRFYTDGEDPGTVNAALSGLVVTDGGFGVEDADFSNPSNPAKFTFGRDITADEVLFLLDVGPSNGSGVDDVRLGLIDGENNRIGTFDLILNNIGDDSLLSTDLRFETFGEARQLNDAKLFGITFSISDFQDDSDVPFSGSNASGVVLLDSNVDGDGEVDIAVIGSATAIPEPTSVALMGLGALCMFVPRRRGA